MQTSGFSTINPSTGEQIETFSFYNSSEIEGVLVRAEKSFQLFRKSPVHQRAQLLSHLAETLRKNKAQLAKVITTEMGKISRKPKRRSRSARGRRIGMPSTDHKCWQMRRLRPAMLMPTCRICLLGRSSQSC